MFCNECELDSNLQPCHCPTLNLALRTEGGPTQFIGAQKQAVYSILSGNSLSTILIAPAGFGKSFEYEAAIRINRRARNHARTCLVVSPLRALIADQISHLKDVGFQCLDWTDQQQKRTADSSTKLQQGRYDFGMQSSFFPNQCILFSLWPCDMD